MTEAGTERWGPSVERGCWLLSWGRNICRES